MRVSLTQIKKELIETNSGTPLPENLVAVAVNITSNGTANHAGIVIGVNSKYYLFHFLPDSINLHDVGDATWLYHKQLEVINQKESETFLSHCEKVKKHSKVKYGFMFDGSYYNDEGKYFSETGLPEYSTCVGFCINVISGFLYENKKYYEVSDWDAISSEHPTFKQYYDKVIHDNPGINEDSFKTHHRRISPAEYVAGAYFNSLPIRKALIDSIISNVQIVISQKRNSVTS